MENTALVNNLTNILNGLDDSQEKLEKDAFDVINSSDTSLNLVRESIGSVEEILKMIDTLNAVVEESSEKIQKLEKLSADILRDPLLLFRVYHYDILFRLHGILRLAGIWFRVSAAPCDQIQYMRGFVCFFRHVFLLTCQSSWQPPR